MPFSHIAVIRGYNSFALLFGVKPTEFLPHCEVSDKDCAVEGSAGGRPAVVRLAPTATVSTPASALLLAAGTHAVQVDKKIVGRFWPRPEVARRAYQGHLWRRSSETAASLRSRCERSASDWRSQGAVQARTRPASLLKPQLSGGACSVKLGPSDIATHGG
jgi:hypothetical protein